MLLQVQLVLLVLMVQLVLQLVVVRLVPLGPGWRLLGALWCGTPLGAPEGRWRGSSRRRCP